MDFWLLSNDISNSKASCKKNSGWWCWSAPVWDSDILFWEYVLFNSFTIPSSSPYKTTIEFTGIISESCLICCSSNFEENLNFSSNSASSKKIFWFVLSLIVSIIFPWWSILTFNSADAKLKVKITKIVNKTFD